MKLKPPFKLAVYRHTKRGVFFNFLRYAEGLGYQGVWAFCITKIQGGAM